MSRNDPLMFDWTLIDQQKCANKCPSINFCCFRPVWFERPEKCLPCNTQSNMTIIDFINSQNATVEGASFWQWLPFWHILGLLMATLFFGISLVGSILICRKLRQIERMHRNGNQTPRIQNVENPRENNDFKEEKEKVEPKQGAPGDLNPWSDDLPHRSFQRPSTKYSLAPPPPQIHYNASQQNVAIQHESTNVQQNPSILQQQQQSSSLIIDSSSTQNIYDEPTESHYDSPADEPPPQQQQQQQQQQEFEQVNEEGRHCIVI